MKRPSPLQFFGTVLRPSIATVAAFGVLLAYAGYLVRGDPDLFGQVFGVALFFQMFCASTGYAERARRGHYDSILVGRSSRWSIALAHWIVSLSPGVVMWMLLAALALVSAPGRWPVPLTPAGLAALAWASTAVWAVTVLLPRYTGGVLWIALVLVLVALHKMAPLQDTFLSGEETWAEALPKARVALTFPILLVGRPEAAGARTLVLVALATLITLTIGVLLIEQLDGVLRDPS